MAHRSLALAAPPSRRAARYGHMAALQSSRSHILWAWSSPPPAEEQALCLPASYWQVRPDIASKAISSWLSLSFSRQVPIRFVCRYDPVFQVKTIDGRTVWRRRHYRVKRDRVPGTFRFSVGGLGSGGLLCCASWPGVPAGPVALCQLSLLGQLGLLRCANWARCASWARCALPSHVGLLWGASWTPLQAPQGTFLSLRFQSALMHCCLPPPALPPAQVLDNGVTSSEFWRILDCAEDLEWCACFCAAVAAGRIQFGLGWRTAAGMIRAACSCALLLCVVHSTQRYSTAPSSQFQAACPAALPRMAGSQLCRAASLSISVPPVALFLTAPAGACSTTLALHRARG